MAWIILGLILVRLMVELGLAWLNQRQVRAHAASVPEVFREFMDGATYQKAVAYTLARSRWGQVVDVYDTTWLGLVLFSGILPWGFARFTQAWGDSAWSVAMFICCVSVGLSLPGLPFEWHEQFKLEARFGFNATTPKLWCLDRLKGLMIGSAMGWPLLALLLKVVDWTPDSWWILGWAIVLGFQVIMMGLAPILILPLFNTFTPLADGSLRDRLLGLARRTGFAARSIQVMDGSKRSRHSNAFFTGIGRFRKIVLYDTLMAQLSEIELEAVLAHEIGHYRKGHITKMVLGSAVGLLGGFYLLDWLSRAPRFYRAFGFDTAHVGLAFLLLSLLGGTLAFWLTPLFNYVSRRFEYQADAFAAQAMGATEPLVQALRKLSEKNLSNLTPHPIYSAVYYSHPSLIEREQALNRGISVKTTEVNCGGPS
jgi:STE24 endopeptidase